MNGFNMKLNETDLNNEIRRALNEGTPHLGGNTVPEIVASTVMQLSQAKAQVAGLFPSVTMTSNVYHPNRIAGGTTAYKVPEGDDITDSGMSFVRDTLYAKKFGAKIKNITNELLEDTNVNIWAEIGPQMTEDIARLVDKEILEGSSGGPSGDGFDGLANAAGVQTLDAEGADGDVIDVKKVIRAKSLMTRYGIRPTHLICAPRDTDEIEFWEDGGGRPLLNQDNYGTPLLGENRIGKLKGLFIVEADQIAINRTKGGSSDASNAYLIADKRAGLVGNKRGMTMKREENIDNDTWKTVMTYRKAFAVQDPLAVVVIKDLIPS